MAIADRLTKLTTDIESAYNSIKNKKEKILPDTYTQVEYIESTGTQYINTGVVPTNTMKIEVKYLMYYTQSTYNSAFGSQDQFNFFINNGFGDNNMTYWYNDGSNNIYKNLGVISQTDYNISTYDLPNNTIKNYNNELKTELTDTISATVFPSVSMYLFARNNNNSSSYISYANDGMKCWYFKVWNNGTLIRNMIPCYRNSDNVIGMYDLINDVFYTNQGTGTFLKGYDTAIGMDKNTENLASAIDSIQGGIIEDTAEGESLSLTNTKAMPYKDYKVKGKSVQEGTPSPSSPVDINSVADDVNLFDIGVKSDYRGYNDQNVTTQGNYSWFTIENNKLKYLVQDYGTTLIYNKNQYKGNQSYNLQYVASSIYSRMLIKLRNGSDNGWLTDSDVTISGWTYIGAYNGWYIEFSEATNIEKIVNIPNCLYCVFGFGYGSYSGTTGTNQTISFIKIAKGSTPTSYTPYNQGTVTIKQEDVKNYLDWNKFIDYSNWIDAESAGYKSFEISGLDTNKIYTLCRVDTAGYGEELKFAGFRNYKDNGNIFLHSTNNSQNLRNISSSPTEDGKIYINMFMNSQNDLNDYITIIKKCWVIEGTEYQEYVNNNYTIQTEPLRSLPNGVKDTMELQDMQNHTRIGRQTGTLTETTTITLSDAKSNGTYMCNIKEAGTLTGQTIELEAGDYEIIYELEQETIEPLTQNQATTMLDIIKTGSYEGTTNIYTDEDVKPTIGVRYYKKG